ncbi:Bacteriophage Mu Gp45 protein [Roseomonas rosea]|uniref:Bacteriophage Mu Gp45 protein n=1 Tax=Muricoccus roseus TaxID=198092 RepID=A0A1M6LDL7_9PROT|nr:phage baseplate assembly protein [Roseomonas rosea]SHJ69331.1 Bacteriophage Mu Gp45 protein [Roseomonas rosea]
MSGTVERLYGRLMSVVGIARISASKVLGGSGVRRYQCRFDGAEVRDGTPSVQQYGLTSRAKVGADAVVIFVGGNRGSGVIIATNDRRYQLELEEGEVAIHDDLGHKVHLSRTGIRIDGGGHNLTITGVPKLLQDGDIEATGDVKAGTISLLEHKHTSVMPGGGQSGPPTP